MTTLSSTLLTCIAVLVGCADPRGKFDEFADRTRDIKENSASGGGSGEGGSGGSGEGGSQGGNGGGSGCVVPGAGASDGDFLFALSASLGPDKPVLFLTQLKTAAKDNSIEFSMHVQPLNDVDRKTPTGASVDVGPFPVAADGTFDAQLPSITVPADANPLLHNEFDATTRLTGTMCAPAEFICGAVSGNVTRPTPLPLDGSTFAMVKITDANNYPEVVINCAGDKAPLP